MRFEDLRNDELVPSTTITTKVPAKIAFSTEEYHYLFGEMAEKTGLSEIEKTLRHKADELQKPENKAIYDQLITRSLEATQLTEKKLDDFVPLRIAQKLKRDYDVDLAVVAGMRGDPTKLSAAEMVIVNRIFNELPKHSIPEYSDSQKGISAKDIEQALSDRALMNKTR